MIQTHFEDNNIANPRQHPINIILDKRLTFYPCSLIQSHKISII
jgi:hypothetical protein